MCYDELEPLLTFIARKVVLPEQELSISKIALDMAGKVVGKVRRALLFITYTCTLYLSLI